MRLIAAVNADLQKSIPGQVGLYDDAFNRNCVGDTFQMLGTPTILFEAGHFPDDYQREKTRELIFHALIVATETIANHELDHYEVKDYLAIPENNKLFFDVLVKNRQFLNPGNSSEGDAGILFREVLEQKKILFKPYIERTGNLDGHYGHKVYDCSNNEDQIALKSNKALYQLIN